MHCLLDLPIFRVSLLSLSCNTSTHFTLHDHASTPHCIIYLLTLLGQRSFNPPSVPPLLCSLPPSTSLDHFFFHCLFECSLSCLLACLLPCLIASSKSCCTNSMYYYCSPKGFASLSFSSFTPYHRTLL
ncbi:hypothetical protein DL93DRAFT_1212956 [Clavulina sp. PMI_390]|nr:hypothetical protein DL93DRAFT_1212956 [Clavulina sp. PMI_390]